MGRGDKTTAVVLFGAAVVLLAVWKLRGSQEPSTAPPKRGSDTGATGASPSSFGSPGRRPALSGKAAKTPARGGKATAGPADGTSATSIDMPPTMPMAEALRRIPPMMKKAAKPCLEPNKHPANSAERVSFHYTVEYRDGRGRVSNVAPVDTNINDEDLQNCILDHVEKLHWDAAGTPDRTSRRQQLSISIYDLSH